MLKPRYLKTGTKVYAFWLLSFCALTQATSAANETADRQADRSAIRAVLNTQQEAWNRGDIDAFLTDYWHSPDLTFSGSNGISRGGDAVSPLKKENYPDRSPMGPLDFPTLNFASLVPMPPWSWATGI